MRHNHWLKRHKRRKIGIGSVVTHIASGILMTVEVIHTAAHAYGIYHEVSCVWHDPINGYIRDTFNLDEVEFYK